MLCGLFICMAVYAKLAGGTVFQMTSKAVAVQAFQMTQSRRAAQAFV